jgi:hypothetical protein
MYLTRVPDGWIISVAISVTTAGSLVIAFLCSSFWFYILGGCCLFLATLVSLPIHLKTNRDYDTDVYFILEI